MYSIRQGESISDVVSNSSGNISNWSLYLDANNFSSWTPDLFDGQNIITPLTAEINPTNVTALNTYPANNFAGTDVYEQIDTIFGILAGASAGIVPDFEPIVIDTSTIYVVREGEQLSDIVENSTGSILNWSDIINANNLDWDTLLYSGQKLIIPSTVIMSLNNFRGLNTYPANNNSVPDVYIQIDAIFEQMINPIPSDWILLDGFWGDTNRYWRDFAKWID